MTKRILSAILAVVLVVTSLAVPVFGTEASAGAKLTKDEGSNKLTLTWSPVEGAKIYQVSFIKDEVTVNSTTVTVSGSEDNTAAKCTVTYTPSVGGNYYAQVSAKKVANGAQLALYTSNSISIPLTGSGSGGLQITSSGNITSLSWNNDGYSTNYYVEYTTSEGKSGFYVKAASEDKKTSTTISTALNDIKSIVIYKANVAGDAYSETLATWTNNGSSTGGNTGSSSGVQIQGNINVSVSGSKGVVTWGAVPNASAYTVTISNNSGSYPQRFGPSTTSATFDYYSNMAYNIIVSATVNGRSSVIGVAEIAAGSGGSSIGGTVVATRPSSNSSSVFLQWTGNSAPYLITYSASGYGSQTQVANTNYITLNCDPNYSWVFTVSSLTNGSVVGYAALNRGSSSSSNNSGSIGTTGSLTISRGLNSSVVSWPSVSGATGYIVTYKSSSASYSSNQFVSSTSFTVPYGSSETWTVTVQALYGNQTITVGSATVTPSGITQGGSTSSSNTTQGNNCTVTSYDNYAVLSWSGTGRAPYTVIYYLNGNTTNGQMISTNSTSIQLNISRSYSYVAIVLDSQNRQVAYVSVKGSTSTGGGSTSGDITKTEIVNLTATPKNGWQTTISWNRRSDAVAYIVMYGLLGATASEDTQVIATSVDIPFSSSIGYQVYVYALTSTGRTYEVGHIYNVPGSTGSTDNDDDVKDYPTNFKATSGNEKVTLSWDAADGASSYTIYYRRATSSKWLRAGTISRTAVNITGLTNGVDYEFKVTANGNDSGIVEIAPSATTSTTVIARDPADDNDDVTVSDEISLISVTSTSRGTITATWTPVSGATSYRVYVAEGASSTYRNKGTFTGTTAVISGLNSGKTYKVRVLKLPVEGDTATALAACDYMQVTVR